VLPPALGVRAPRGLHGRRASRRLPQLSGGPRDADSAGDPAPSWLGAASVSGCFRGPGGAGGGGLGGRWIVCGRAGRCRVRRLPAVVFRGLGCVFSPIGFFACLSAKKPVPTHALTIDCRHCSPVHSRYTTSRFSVSKGAPGCGLG